MTAILDELYDDSMEDGLPHLVSPMQMLEAEDDFDPENEYWPETLEEIDADMARFRDEDDEWMPEDGDFS
tara:strand:+ start:132184 stop:132393 length:210 start_codon:yes stop_codon:yes gene_type:complete